MGEGGSADGRSVLVLGESGGLGEALARWLEQGGTAVERAMSLSDSEVGGDGGRAAGGRERGRLVQDRLRDGHAGGAGAGRGVHGGARAPLSRRRLTTLFGPRAAPARGHVLLVGFGQVGFRLAQELHRRGVAVLGVERDADAPCVRLARGAGIPVAIGRGDDRETLERLGIRRCAVVAAVTSDDLVNVEVGLAASDLAPSVPLVLRLGDGEVAAETDSLLHLGRICDAHKIAADTLVRGLGGSGGGRLEPT